MIIINMPGGAVEFIGEKDLLWMRKAFPDERKDAIMLRVGSDRIYSIESLDDLRAKFAQAKVPIADFTPPEGKLTMVVNVANVEAVEPGNPIIFHEKARALLRFSRKVKLAVRETEAEAKAKIAAAQPPPRPRIAGAARARARNA